MTHTSKYVAEFYIHVALNQCIWAKILHYGVWDKGAGYVIFVFKQLQEKFFGKNKELYFVVIEVEKAFDWKLGEKVYE